MKLNKITLSLVGMTLSLGFMGSAWAQTIQIGALVTGQVTDVDVKVGQKVKPGQLLLKIDDTRYQAKLKSASAEVEIQRLKWADAKIDLTQALDLYDRTVSAKRELDAVQLKHDLALQAYQKAQAELEYLQAWSKYYTIQAPVAGTIQKINAPKGATVFQENTPLIQIEH